MQIAFWILTTVGLIVAFVGWIWMLSLAFQVSFLWGFGSLIPMIMLVFAVSYWDDVKQPFRILVGGNLLLILARFLI